MILRKVEGSWEPHLDWACQEEESSPGASPIGKCRQSGGCVGNFYLVGVRIETVFESCHG